MSIYKESGVDSYRFNIWMKLAPGAGLIVPCELQPCAIELCCSCPSELHIDRCHIEICHSSANNSTSLICMLTIYLHTLYVMKLNTSQPTTTYSLSLSLSLSNSFSLSLYVYGTIHIYTYRYMYFYRFVSDNHICTYIAPSYLFDASRGPYPCIQ